MSKLIRKPIYPDMDNICNNRNLHEYSPYFISDKVNIIDQDWYNSLSDYCKDLIKQRIKNFIIEPIKIPHEFQFDNEEKFLAAIYKCYIDSFDYNCWYQYLKTNNVDNTPNNVVMIPISTDLKRLFIELHENHQHYSNEIKILKEFRDEINKYMDSNKEYFIRLSSTSGKNEKSVNIFTKSEDIINHIIGLKLFIDQEYKRENKDSYLILMPFNHKIDQRYEFRIFVVNNKLTAVSQQNRYELHQFSSKELKAIEYSLNNISFLDKCPYTTYVGDVYIDIETKTCNLIELNPFGAHSGAGAALFNWIIDYDLLHGLTDTQPEFRYLSVINY
jgi:hypothetical protein